MTRHLCPLLLLVLVACDGDVSSPGAPRVPASVRIDEPNATVDVGASTRLRIVVRDSAGRAMGNAHVSWSTTGPQLLRVDATGTVTGLVAGRAQVVARSGEAADTVAVRVTVHGAYPGTLEIPGPGFAMLVCATASLTAGLQPAIAGAPIRWSSSHPDVLAVDSAGRLQARSPGQAIITAAWANDTAIFARRTIGVATILPSPIQMGPPYRTGTTAPLPLDSVSGRIDVPIHFGITEYFGGVVELRIDDTLVGTVPYPGGCPQRMDPGVVRAIDTGAFTNGEHRLTALLLRAPYAPPFRVELPITIRN